MELQEQRHVYYDRDLDLEAYQLRGTVQKFPNHFHPYYVVGFIEGGRRHLWCRQQEYDLDAGDLILFNPRDNHYCAPVDGEPLDYRAVNVKPETMRRAVREITGGEDLPRFAQNVVRQSELTAPLGELYDAVVRQAPRMEKEEAFFFLMEQVLRECAAAVPQAGTPAPTPEIQALCAFMERHFDENLTLDDLLAICHCSKSWLLRSFTRQVGVSPYRYLQTVRLDRAKRFLEQGVAPIDAAALAGFADQSHFTNFFKAFIGLTPKQYQRIFTAAQEPPEALELDVGHAL